MPRTRTWTSGANWPRPFRTTRRSTASTRQPRPVTGWPPCWRVCRHAGWPGARCTSPGDRRPRVPHRAPCRGRWCSWRPARTAPRTCWPTCSRPNWTGRRCRRRWRCSPRAPPCPPTTGRRSPRPDGSRWVPRSSRRQGWSSPGRLRRRRRAQRPGRRARPAWRHPHPSIRRPPRAVRSRRCPPTRGPGRPPAGRSPPRAGRTRRRCSWCPRRTRSLRCRARRAAPHGDAGRRPAGWRSRRLPVVRRRHRDRFGGRRGRAAVRPTLTGAPIPPDAGPADVAPDTDPFHGPLRVPLLAPLLDPTAPGADEPDYRPPDPTPIRPVPALPATGRTPGGCAGGRMRSRPRPGPGASRLVAPAPPSRPAHVPTLDRAASSRRASSPTFRPAGGDGTPRTSRPARPGRSRPSWRRATRVRRVRAHPSRTRTARTARTARTTCRRSGRTTGGRVNGRCPRPSRRSPLPTARSPPRRSTSSGRPPRTAPSRMRPSGPDAPRCRRARFPSYPAPRCRTGPRPSDTPSAPSGPGSRTRHVRSPIFSARTRAARSRSRRQVVGTARSPRRDPIGRAARGRRPTGRCSTRPPHGSAPRRGRPDRPRARSRPRPPVTRDVPCL